MLRWVVALVALFAVGCGDSSPTGPTPPPPAPTTQTATVSLTDSVSGASIGTSAQVVTGFPAQLTFAVPGYVTRQTWVRGATASVDLIPEAGFDLAFFRQLARNGYEAPGNLEALRVLSQPPSIYLQTTGLSAANVAALENAARVAVHELSGHRFDVGAFESGTELRGDRQGWITVEVFSDTNQTCGRTFIGASAGHSWVNIAARCGFNGYAVDPPLFAHEIGHAMGFWHVEARGHLMHPRATFDERTSVEPSALERTHAAIAYKRPVGNRDIDVDPSSTTGLIATRLIID